MSEPRTEHQDDPWKRVRTFDVSTYGDCRMERDYYKQITDSATHQRGEYAWVDEVDAARAAVDARHAEEKSQLEADNRALNHTNHGLNAELRTLREQLAAKPSVEICRQNRAAGRGPCGACALCCKEQYDRAETLSLQLAAVWPVDDSAGRGERTGTDMSNEATVRPLVIYHANCWDGFCAAWIARKALGDCEFFPGYYGQSPPDVTGRRVYLLDFSYPRDVMERLATLARRTVVLDHHKTAMAALDGLHQPETGIDVIFDMDKSGGRLAWLWFWHMKFKGMPAVERPFPMPVREDRAPWLVDYTEDRDLWRHALEGTEEINAALRSYPLDFELWDRFAEKDPRSTFYFEGAAIRRAERQIVDTHVRNAREVEMGGHRVLSVNATVLFSEIAGELAKGRPFGACYFDRQDGKRQWSLRSDANGVDVSELARTHGGGGHAHAAGFEESRS